MGRYNADTRLQIIAAAETLLSSRDSGVIRINDVAETANIGVPTVYYYFESRDQLIAEAQASIYLKLIEPLHQYLAIAEAAIIAMDEATLLGAMGDNLAMAWSLGQLDGGWKMTKLLMDVWSDPTTQRAFCKSLDAQLERWITAIESSKSLGWIDQEIEVNALITSCWTGSMRQAIFSDSEKMKCSPESIRDFFLKTATRQTSQS